MNIQSKTKLYFLLFILHTAVPALAIEPISMAASWLASKLLKMGVQEAKRQLIQGPAREFFNTSMQQLKNWDDRRKRDNELKKEHDSLLTLARNNRLPYFNDFDKKTSLIGSLDKGEAKSRVDFINKQNHSFKEFALRLIEEYQTKLSELNTEADIRAQEQYQQEIALEKHQKELLAALKKQHKNELKSLIKLSVKEYKRITDEQYEQQDRMKSAHANTLENLEKEHQELEQQANQQLQDLKNNILSSQQKDIDLYLQLEKEKMLFFIKELEKKRAKRISNEVKVGIAFVAFLAIKAIYESFPKLSSRM